MSSEDIDPESTIPWPGFVDILSTVIIVFVFFMMMTSVIIFVLSDQAKKAAVDNAVEQSKSDVKHEQPAPTENVSNLLLEKENLEREIDKLTQLKNVLSESTLQSNAQAGNVITIEYGDMGATLTPESSAVIEKALPFQGRVTITAFIPAGSDFGSIREIALNRALNIRNVLLQNNIERDHIALKITSAKPQADGSSNNPYGSVTLTFEY